LIHGLVEARVEVGSLRVRMRRWVAGLVVGGILGRVEMVFCLSRFVEVREAVGMMGVRRHDWVVAV
jgi:hypothetical protein